MNKYTSFYKKESVIITRIYHNKGTTLLGEVCTIEKLRNEYKSSLPIVVESFERRTGKLIEVFSIN